MLLKKFIAFSLSLLMLCVSLGGICAWAEEAEIPEEIKILCIGNSFSCDTIEHVANIALSLGVKKVTLGNLYIGGCSIKKHYANAVGNLASYEYFYNTGSGWTSTYNHSIKATLESDDWDYVSIQHGTNDGSRYAEEASYTDLSALAAYIRGYVSDSTKIVFNMTWVGEPASHEEMVAFGNDQIKYYTAVAALTESLVAKTEGIDIVSPTGTAIQNARTASVGLLTRDNYHLSLDLGRYIAGLTFFKALTGADITDISWAPATLNEYKKQVAVEAVNNAFESPYGVTASLITPPEFEWPTGVDYGVAATPANPYYPHASKSAPEVDEKVDILSLFNFGVSVPAVSSTLETANGLGLVLDLNKTPYLYYSFVIPEGSDFCFSVYSDSTYSPWLTFLDAGKGDAVFSESAETWDAAFAAGRTQYATLSQTGCIDLREYAKGDALKWVVSRIKLYDPKGSDVVVSYMFFGSEPTELPEDLSSAEESESVSETVSKESSAEQTVSDTSSGSSDGGKNTTAVIVILISAVSLLTVLISRKARKK